MELEFHQLDLRYEGLRARRPERERRLLASLAERGQQIPIVVVAEDRYLVIDGYKRLRALKQLRQDTVQATVWTMGAAEALLLERSLRASEGETAIEQGWLLAELHQSFSLSLEQLAARFDRSTSFISRRLALVRELPQSIQSRVQRGQISAGVAMKYLVPMARAKRDDCEALAAAMVEHKLTSREVAELYEAWRAGSAPLRRRLLEAPELFLRVQREHTQPPEPQAETVLRELDLVGVLARRVCRRWAQAEMSPKQRHSARLCLAQARSDLERLWRKTEEEVVDAEPIPAGGDPGASHSGDLQAPDCQGAEGLALHSQEGDSLGLVPAARGEARDQGCRPSSADPGAVCFLRREQGPSP